MILKNARNQDNVSLPGNSPPAGRESSQSFSHRWWFPSWSCNTPWMRRMTSRGVPSTGSLEIWQRSGQKQKSWRVPIQNRGCNPARSSHSEYPMAQTICIGLLYFSMLINILCFKPLIHMILNISFRYHINIWGVIYFILINQSEFTLITIQGKTTCDPSKGNINFTQKCVKEIILILPLHSV